MRLLRVAGPEFDRYITDPSPDLRSRIASSYARMRGFPPAFDVALSYAPPTFMSVNAYGIPAPADGRLPRIVRRHPEIVLRDGEGRPLYIPFDCERGRCSQFAADFGSDLWQDRLITRVRRQVSAGYAGVHVDDVNMEFRVTDGLKEFVRPRDPRTGQPMSLDAWRGYMASFMERMRKAFPSLELSHNPIWFAGHSDEAVARQLRAADLIELERGYTDRGLVGGRGQFGFERLLAHVDWLHRNGIGVITEPYALDRQGAEFELATALLTIAGNDLLAADYRTRPGRVWRGWKVDLGAASGDRYEWQGMLRRDFESGLVLVNPPGSAVHAAEVPSGSRDIGGRRVERIALGPGEARVLVTE